MNLGIALYGSVNTLAIKVPLILTLLAMGTSPVTERHISDLKGCGSVNNIRTSSLLEQVFFVSSAIFSILEIFLPIIGGKGMWNKVGIVSLMKSLSFQLKVLLSHLWGLNFGQHSGAFM
jgi:hypothetical protein